LKKRTGKTVAVVGSGPAGLACADQLNKAGHVVTVFERDDKPGGILRYGIPDFKLEKWVIDRRIKLMKKDGIIFKNNIDVGGEKFPSDKVLKEFDAVCLTGGSRVPRDLNIEGRDLKGIHFAMDYLIQNNKRAKGKHISKKQAIHAKGKRVVVIGGGDTGADCVGTAHRQGAASVVQIEVMPKPPECRTEDYPWPRYPLLLKSSTSHQEGGQRQWSVLTKQFIGEKGKIKKLSCLQVEFKQEAPGTCPVMSEVSGSEFEIEADLVILAIGFIHPEHKGILSDFHLEYDQRGNVKANENFMTSTKGIFTAGDMHRGQSLIVWAISEGRQAAFHIDKYLMGSSQLPVF
jgi:glutamate synthase (NADPH/NADH) small chain